MAQQIGRNEPCPCGSGKKYKHCCMQRDRSAALKSTQETTRIEENARSDAVYSDAAMTSRERLDVLRQNVQSLLPHVAAEKAQELQRLLTQVESATAYATAQDEIEAASKKLELHYDAFMEHISDSVRAMELASRLFSEEIFRPLWFSVEDVRRAFAEMGYDSPRHRDLKEHDVDTVIKAILYLAQDRDWRAEVSRRLTLLMVDYVNAERYLEAWMLHYSAYLMLKNPNRSNPFLFEMFRHGYDLWVRQLEEQQLELLEVLGIDPKVAQSMTREDLTALMQASATDPVRRVALQEYLSRHSVAFEDFERAGVGRQSVEQEVLDLLTREEPRRFLLSTDEVDAYLSTVMMEAMPLLAALQEKGETPDQERVLDILGQALMKQAQTLAGEVFKPERLARLVADLKAYAQELRQGNRTGLAEKIDSVCVWLLADEDVSANLFLIGLGYASLRVAMLSVTELASQSGDASDVEPPD